MKTIEVDNYLLQLPHLCDSCLQKAGLTRHGFLIPKPKELYNVSESIDAFMQVYPDFIKKTLERSLKDLIDKGMSESDAKILLNIKS